MLYAHRSERADQLLAALGDVLAEPLADPLVPEVVSVPTRGVERWLTQSLSHRLGVSPNSRDGVCANFAFPFPGGLIGAAVALGAGIDPQEDPWPSDRSVWPLLEVVDRDFDDPFLEPLAEHIRRAGPPGNVGELARPRRFGTVRHLADLFDHYGTHRPEMVRDWAAASDAAGGAGVRGWWQAELWRRLRARIGVESPAERLESAVARLQRDPGLLDLPSRISMFGLTRLPGSHVQILRAIASARDVHLFLLYPSAALWEKVAATEPRPPLRMLRAHDRTARLPANPLLRSWGRDAREMQLVFGAHDIREAEHRPVPEGGLSLLARIQSDIRADRPPPPTAAPGATDPRPLLAESDDSLRLHSCHGRFRQVEVMRDAILHLFSADGALEPRDVIVMCPDIEHYAPLLHAALAGVPQPMTAAPQPPGSRNYGCASPTDLCDRQTRC